MGKIIEFKPRHNNKKVYLVLGLLMAATVALLYINLVHSAYEKTLTLAGTSIMNLDNSSYSFAKSGEHIVVCGQEGVTAINKNGETAWKYSRIVNDPIACAAGKYVLISDLGGYSSYLISGGKEVFAHESAFEIITAKVNQNGYFAVAAKERGYKSRVQVFSPGGEQIYAWHSTKYYVIDVAVSGDNKSMLVSVLNTDSSDSSICKVLYFSFSQQEPVILDTGEDNLVASLENSGGYVFAVGDMALYCFDKNGKKQFDLSYNGRTLQEYAIGEGVIALALTKGSIEGYYGGSVVETYNTKGAARGAFEIADEIDFLDIDSKKILVNSEDGAYILSDTGHLYGNLTFENEVREGLIFSGGKKLLLVNGSAVNVYDAK